MTYENEVIVGHIILILDSLIAYDGNLILYTKMKSYQDGD